MTNYITSVGVQQFSITIASGSTTGTATITAVGSGAFIIYGGVNPSVSNNAAEDFARLSISGTTITATRNTGTAGTVVVTSCIIDGDTTNLIKSVQYGTISVASNSATGTASISAVTNANTAIHFLGHTSTTTSWVAAAEHFRLSLSGTTVTATRGSSVPTACTVNFVAIEFQGSALNQSVQNVSASNSVAGATSWTATITSVNVNNAISIYGNWSNATNTAGSLASAFLNGNLTNSTTFTVNLNTSTGGGAAKVYNTSIVEFVSGVLNSVAQRGTTTLTGATSNTSTITGVTAANSGISYLGNTATATTTVLDQAESAVVLTNGTTVTASKNTSTSNTTSSWEVFEFPAFSGGTVLGAAWNPYYTMFGACSGSGYNV